MLCACIDIGSNTTRVLVAEVSEGRLRERHQRRAFTRMGADLGRDRRLSRPKIDELVEVVGEYRALAAHHGAEVRTVATAAVRGAANREELVEALSDRAGVEVEILSTSDEARLAFLGATRTLGRPLPGVIGVVDVGGGSSEIAVGTVAAGVSWSTSLPIGSGLLSDAHHGSDPASPEDLRAMAEHAAALLGEVEIPPVETAVAVGGSATSLRRVVGPRLSVNSADAVIARLCSAPARELAERFGLAEERVRLLPAGILILAAAADRLVCPLELGCGGIREGVCLELASASPPNHPS